MKAIVSGALANKCQNGGNAWSRLNWILGLRKLGCDVLFVEQIDRRQCLLGTGLAPTVLDSDNWRFFQQVCSGFGLSGRAALVIDGEEILGMERDELRDFARA